MDNSQLTRLLQSVDRTGDYCIGDKIFAFMPQIEVDGVGQLSFPVTEQQIDLLIHSAERAPFGKGTETVIDTSVRDCWQIDGSLIHITGKAWSESFNKIMKEVSEGLGLDDDQLHAEIYKLLVYQKGGFFSAHRDTEKVKRMIGTLSLSLPTVGEGGELVVLHGGKESIYDMNVQEPSELAYVAFYSDCVHEVKPITEGHRVSLIFNLFLKSNSKWIGAPNHDTLSEKIQEFLTEWKTHGQTNKMVWLLEYSYSTGGFSFDTLKGIDATVAEVLGQAAINSDCSMHGAVLHIEENGQPDYDDYSYWGDTTGDDCSMVEVYDRSEYLKDWVSLDGTHPPLGDIPIHLNELLPPDALDDAEPDEKVLEDYTGNAGPTLEQFYHFAALVVWPNDKTVEILSKVSIDQALSWVSTQLTEVTEEEFHQLLSHLSKHWPETTHSYSQHPRAKMIELITASGHFDIAIDFLDRIVVHQYNTSENQALAKLLPHLNHELLRKFLPQLVENSMMKYPTEVISLLVLILENLDEANRAWKELIRKALRLLVSNLNQIMEAGTENSSDRESYFHHIRSFRVSYSRNERLSWDSRSIQELFYLAHRFELADKAVEAAKTVVNFPTVATPDRVIPKALQSLCDQEEDHRAWEYYKILWEHSAKFLLQRSSVPPAKPDDWTMDVSSISSNDHITRDLRTFCLDPTSKTMRFTVNQSLRKEIRGIIDRHHLDLDYRTIKQGRPYTLVCTKNRNSYKRRLEEYSDDVKSMDILLREQPDCKPSDGDGKFIQALASAKALGDQHISKS